jgi:hypothetical protein
MIKIYSVRIVIGILILITGILSPGILITSILIRKPLFKLIAESLKKWHNKTIQDYIFAPVSDETKEIIRLSAKMTLRAGLIAFRNGIRKIVEYDKAIKEAKQAIPTAKDKKPVNELKTTKKRAMKTTKELLRNKEYNQN